jgi:hypothetical protein
MESFTVGKKRVLENWMTDYDDHIRAMGMHLLDPGDNGQLLLGLNTRSKDE